MPKWITTRHYRIHYDWEHEKKEGGVAKNTDHFRTPMHDLDTELARLIDFCDLTQFTIKATVPITGSLGCYDYSSNQHHSYGHGYGISQIVGFIVILQKEEEVSQEEYTRRKAITAFHAEIPFLEEQVGQLQKRLDEIKSHSPEILEKKGLLSGVKFSVGWRNFDLREEAVAFQQEMLSEIAGIEAKLAAAKADVEKKQKEYEVVRDALEDIHEYSEWGSKAKHRGWLK